MQPFRTTSETILAVHFFGGILTNVMQISSLNKLTSWNYAFLDRSVVFLNNIILFDFFFLTFIFSLKNWKIRVFFCRRDNGSFLYDIHREGKEQWGGGGRGRGDHRIFANFVNVCRWFWERVVWPCWTSICTCSKSFFLWYLKTS